MNETWWVDESQLDEDQRNVIGLGPAGNHLIMGPPGSGKTNLLLLRANYLCTYDKPNVMILVFTRPLREFIVSGASRYKFSSNKVKTYHSWAMRLLGVHDIELPSPGNFKEKREEILVKLQDLVAEEGITDAFYDAILIDEAHDYFVEEIELFRNFTKNLFAVADSRQQIYRRDSSIIEHLRSSLHTIELRYHFRNGIEICRLADLIMRGRGGYTAMEPTSNYDEEARPSNVRSVECATIERQCEEAIDELNTQLKAYPGELLGVISPRREELEQIKTYFSQSPIADFCIFQDSESGYVPFEQSRPICISTVHGSKGLEFRAVHIMACETFWKFPRTNRNLTFTGVTRAKTSLSLYYSDELYAYLESALAGLSPRQDRPKISEAFGPGD